MDQTSRLTLSCCASSTPSWTGFWSCWTRAAATSVTPRRRGGPGRGNNQAISADRAMRAGPDRWRWRPVLWSLLLLGCLAVMVRGDRDRVRDHRRVVRALRCVARHQVF